MCLAVCKFFGHGHWIKNEDKYNNMPLWRNDRKFGFVYCCTGDF